MTRADDLYKSGDRVEMAVHTDLWMRGARFGTVLSAGKTKLRVKLDKLNRAVYVHVNNVHPLCD